MSSEIVYTRRHRWFFAVTGILIALFPAASSAPSPLYVVYQHEWGFSSATLTVIFAIYVLGLLAALLVVGRLSDHIGRRPVLLAAIALEIVSMGIFLVAGDTLVLCLARLVQGIATGTAISVLGAGLVDLAPAGAKQRAGTINSIAPSVGLALGALGCGALVQYGPAPTHFVYAILLVALVIAGLAVVLMPETVDRRAGALLSLTPKAHLPGHMRSRLLAIIPVLLAGWALGGLYFSLGPSIAVGVFGLDNHLIGGIVITLFCGIAALVSFLVRRVTLQKLIVPAAVAVGVGAVLTLLGVHGPSVAFAFVGTLIAGIGFGAGAVAAFGTVARHSRPEERSGVVAVVYVISYLAFSVPALIAGFATTRFGLLPTTEVYVLVVVALAVLATALGIAAARKNARIEAASGETETTSVPVTTGASSAL